VVTKIRDAVAIQSSSNRIWAAELIGKLTEDAHYKGNLFLRTWDKCHTLISQTLTLTVSEKLFRFSLGIEKLPSQAIGGATPQLIAELR
jgi:hypothetical protein